MQPNLMAERKAVFGLETLVFLRNLAWLGIRLHHLEVQTILVFISLLTS